MVRLASALELPGRGAGARLIAWRVREGERIARGEPVAEVEADATRTEIALDGEGTLLRHLAAPGDWITAELALAVIGEEGDEAAIAALSDAGATPGAEPAATALAVLPPRRLARPMGPAEHVDRQLSPEGLRAAARATAARRDIPRACVHADADITQLSDYCQRLNRMLGDRGRLRPVDLAIKAAAVALRRVPHINAAYMGEAIRFFTRIRVGLAVVVGDELIGAGIRDADLKTLEMLGAEARELAARARAGEVGGGDRAPAALLVCDLGDLGIDRAELISSGDETAVLALGRVRREPVVTDGGVAVGYRVGLTLTCDERVATSAAAGRLLGEIVAILEKPESLAL